MHLDFIQALVDENPRIPLKVISERIEAQFGFKLSKSTVVKHLDMMTYTLKAVRFVPERENSIENKNKRSFILFKIIELPINWKTHFIYGLKRTLIFIFPGEIGVL